MLSCIQLSAASWPWNFPDKNTGVRCHFLPNQRIEPVTPALAGRCFFFVVLFLFVCLFVLFYHCTTWEALNEEIEVCNEGSDHEGKQLNLNGKDRKNFTKKVKF